MEPIYEFCKEHNIVTASFGSLAPITSVRGGPVDPVLASIRERLQRDSGKSVTEAQILGKWLYQKGIVFISYVFV
jgi:diketogulonate reductase-like aldo/keto reductase